jgi:hypothetical protein
MLKCGEDYQREKPIKLHTTNEKNNILFNTFTAFPIHFDLVSHILL